MNAALAVIKTADVQDKLAASGIETAAGSVADFAAFISTERQRLGALAAKAKMSAEQ
jgi:tripartite-type tricarboxylate transporter receptor subunit TctC